MRLAYALFLAALLTGCTKESTKEFGTDKPRVMWDSSGQAWIVQFHIGNVFTVERAAELDR